MIALWAGGIALFLAAVPGNSVANADGGKRDPTNVVLVLTDDQGYGDLSCHGNPELRTPYLDQLARTSICFTDFHVAPMCAPTRGQLFTGQDALRTGAYSYVPGGPLSGEKCRSNKAPFFACISTNAPHGPFFAPAKYKQPYQHLDRDTASFFAMVANIDENMARLDAMLAETGLQDNTILIFMTDNGGTGGVKVYNAGMRGAKASLYEGGHRVPLLLRWPGGRLRRPGPIDALTHVQDLLPTLADLCGLPVPPGAESDGVSLGRLVRGKNQPELRDRKLVVQYGGIVRTQPEKWDSAVMWNRWRLVNGKELYDLATDPGQQRDIAKNHAKTVREMRAHYQDWWSGVAPGLTDFSTITIGSPHENPVCLTSLDWFAPTLVVAAQSFDVRLLGRTQVVEGSLPMGRPSPALNGPWNVRVERDGVYEIALHRWPKEADAAITAGLPPYAGVDGTFPAGQALGAVKARLKIGPIDDSKPVGPNAKNVTFTPYLSAGPTTLQTWFYGARGDELCGAFYVYVRRKASPGDADTGTCNSQ